MHKRALATHDPVTVLPFFEMRVPSLGLWFSYLGDQHSFTLHASKLVTGFPSFKIRSPSFHPRPCRQYFFTPYVYQKALAAHDPAASFPSFKNGDSTAFIMLQRVVAPINPFSGFTSLENRTSSLSMSIKGPWLFMTLSPVLLSSR